MGGLLGKKRMSVEQASRFVTLQLMNQIEEDQPLRAGLDSRVADAALDIIIEIEVYCLVCALNMSPNSGNLWPLNAYINGPLRDALTGLGYQGFRLTTLKHGSLPLPSTLEEFKRQCASPGTWSPGSFALQNAPDGSPFGRGVRGGDTAAFWSVFMEGRVQGWCKKLGQLEIVR